MLGAQRTPNDDHHPKHLKMLISGPLCEPTFRNTSFCQKEHKFHTRIPQVSVFVVCYFLCGPSSGHQNTLYIPKKSLVITASSRMWDHFQDHFVEYCTQSVTQKRSRCACTGEYQFQYCSIQWMTRSQSFPNKSSGGPMARTGISATCPKHCGRSFPRRRCIAS